MDEREREEEPAEMPAPRADRRQRSGIPHAAP